MKRNVMILLLLIATVGCSTAKVEVDPIGNCKAEYTSVLRNSEATEIMACGAGGSTKNSKVDTSMVDLLTEILLRAK
jgi:hypothetical protein